jgi:hypothetical protein
VYHFPFIDSVCVRVRCVCVVYVYALCVCVCVCVCVHVCMRMYCQALVLPCLLTWRALRSPAMLHTPFFFFAVSVFLVHVPTPVSLD